MEKPGVTQRWVGISEPDMGDHLHRGNLAPTLVDTTMDTLLDTIMDTLMDTLVDTLMDTLGLKMVDAPYV